MSTKKPFAFKSSKLSSAADQLWSASKNEFKSALSSSSTSSSSATDSSSSQSSSSTSGTAPSTGSGANPTIRLDLGKTLIDDRANRVNRGNAQADLASRKGFVFGAKLSERVIVDTSLVEASSAKANGQKTEPLSVDVDSREVPKPVSAVFEEIQKKGTNSSFLTTDKGQYDEDGASTSTKLKASADETESQRRETASSTLQKASAQPIEVSTGEENEVNIYHVDCKLHSFDLNTKSWQERGMASIRINRIDDADKDKDKSSSATPQYRIVGRIRGNQRVVLNSRIFADMVLEKISLKRMKFSAATPDSELPILFLTTATEFVTEQFFMTLSGIVDEKKKAAEQKQHQPQQQQQRKRKASSDACQKGDSATPMANDDGVGAKKAPTS